MCPNKIPYIAGYFRVTKFLQITQLIIKHFEDFIFEDRGSNGHTPTVERFQYRMYFRGTKFSSIPAIR